MRRRSTVGVTPLPSADATRATDASSGAGTDVVTVASSGRLTPASMPRVKPESKVQRNPARGLTNHASAVAVSVAERDWYVIVVDAVIVWCPTRAPTKNAPLNGKTRRSP